MECNNSKKYFSPLHLGGILGKNLWYLLTAFPLLSKYHQPDPIPVVQYPSSRPTEGGHMSSFLYDIPFMPRALPVQALWTISQTSFSFIPLSSNITVGSWGFGKSLRGGIRIPSISSKYVIFKWFSNSSFSTSSFPLFDSKKSFFFGSIRIWV